ncbi:MAG TPA: VWA domain-containing protein [Prolixibacteraceae bacterium]|nr:VWA domain-containing protein [Prolixibacteraceae bacterium]
MSTITFARPELFYLLLGLIPMIVWYVLRQKKSKASIQISTIESLKKAPLTWKHSLRHAAFVLQIGVLALLIVCLARPQSSDSWQNQTVEGIDIMIALDMSSSMLARDFQPNRLGAAKSVAIEFVSGRMSDRIGLVVFSAESFTQCPLTTDRAVLINLFQNLQPGLLEDGTAIGLGLANAVSRLKDSKAKSKVVILLTDGENNRGEIAPITAAEIAKTFGIRVYTIGVGTIGTAPYPIQTPFGVQIRDVEVKIDEKTLQEIATITDGRYFRATDNKTLIAIYKEIDRLERTKIENKEFSKKNEEYRKYAIGALVLALFAMILQFVVFRHIP